MVFVKLIFLNTVNKTLKLKFIKLKQRKLFFMDKLANIKLHCTFRHKAKTQL
jgi:hypothetical protein